MLLIADVFMKLRTPKKVVKQISKKSTFRGPFHKQHAKGYQTLFKSEPQGVPHLLLTVKTILWETISLSNMQSLKTAS